MSERAFFLPDARKRVAEAVADVERQTAAEIVVAVRRRSGHYRDADLALGGVLAFAALLVIVFHPMPFASEQIPVDVGVAFAFGALLSANVSAVRRLLVTRARKDEAVRVAARAAFYDMGIARTRGRTGILLFVSIFERRVEVVADTGVPVDAIAEWRNVVAAIDAAGRAADLEQLVAAMKTMAPPLAAALPIQPDDVDELPNEPVVA